MFLPKSTNVSSLLSHPKTQADTLKDLAPRRDGEFNKSVIRIIELLVGKNVTYFGDHYFDLCFLLQLPPGQPDSCQRSQVHSSETPADTAFMSKASKIVRTDCRGVKYWKKSWRVTGWLELNPDSQKLLMCSFVCWDYTLSPPPHHYFHSQSHVRMQSWNSNMLLRSSGWYTWLRFIKASTSIL